MNSLLEFAKGLLTVATKGNNLNYIGLGGIALGATSYSLSHSNNLTQYVTSKYGQEYADRTIPVIHTLGTMAGIASSLAYPVMKGIGRRVGDFSAGLRGVRPSAFKSGDRWSASRRRGSRLRKTYGRAVGRVPSFRGANAVKLGMQASTSTHVGRSAATFVSDLMSKPINRLRSLRDYARGYFNKDPFRKIEGNSEFRSVIESQQFEGARRGGPRGRAAKTRNRNKRKLINELTQLDHETVYYSPEERGQLSRRRRANKSLRKKLPKYIRKEGSSRVFHIPRIVKKHPYIFGAMPAGAIAGFGVSGALTVYKNNNRGGAMEGNISAIRGFQSGGMAPGMQYPLAKPIFNRISRRGNRIQ